MSETCLEKKRISRKEIIFRKNLPISTVDEIRSTPVYILIWIHQSHRQLDLRMCLKSFRP
ncbi:uncharacterized protein MELLADRAFT_88696 [Melampsora larici-populina 98AG31]|uniref:Uncharacterized protein n=1 Tax=Melampsora larici-populina (strain 98AG31 / pathotype 3-4-7) TaxID=747676 RepID=F4RMV8_MELLP|nr:uncharacterized protein MELLADRAFT_87332 [Melampsora larici-populina 98AG31]XP_007412100.1 uncharacterized protein MELLADRAFT_88696 [Melampsora larici-populina 98AG31]EGG04661.1 hypothetical protein MELLADRAFT_88696 [Melampsora larici-populina 98AG31]EGG06180.1 hypothetical protein MELLADRAFT_87332 [Melampsora larici-populina 98AG31]